MLFVFQDKEKKILETVSKAASELGIQAYAVGGYVRDKILNRPSKDIDITCVGSGIELALKAAKIFHPHIKVNVYKNFGTAMFKIYGWDIEFVGARKESYRSDSRNPIVEAGSMEEDQVRRDFTINTLAIDLSPENFGQLIDPFNGIEDLKNKIIKTPLDANLTFNDDPLRMMRAIRFASQLGFEIESNTLKAIAPLSKRLQIISQERITDELNKIILSPQPSIGFNLLFETQLLQYFFPEMVALHGIKMIENYAHKDNFFHTIQVLDNVAKVSDDLWLRWAAILHDIAKPPTQKFEEGHGWTFHGHEVLGAKWVPKIFKRLKLPLNEKMKFVQKLVYLHLRPISLTKENITDSAIRRLIFEAGDDLESLMILCEADITSKNPKKVQRYTENLQFVKQKIKVVEERDRIRNWQPLVDGEMIMYIFQIKPGREVGILKNQLKEAVLEGEIPNEYDASINYILKKGAEINLQAVNQASDYAK
ncbi:MAG: CCA tRNA nucleotidyltransferase [Chitinophagales bacterium]|nr:CCA tRNA nucleotidyltransferase [Chitinophagales bacterium]MCZ2393716.1 CCA tRNA nucleotidyltransferase [Chitinophagales bacterium]